FLHGLNNTGQGLDAITEFIYACCKTLYVSVRPDGDGPRVMNQQFFANSLCIQLVLVIVPLLNCILQCRQMSAIVNFLPVVKIKVVDQLQQRFCVKGINEPIALEWPYVDQPFFLCTVKIGAETVHANGTAAARRMQMREHSGKLQVTFIVLRNLAWKSIQ